MSAMSQTDKLFAEARVRNEAFTFGKDTAAVFDDMLDRSVPFYAEIQRMLGELVGGLRRGRHDDLRPRLLDGQHLSRRRRDAASELNVRFVGLDSSEDMLQQGGSEARRHPLPVALHADATAT